MKRHFSKEDKQIANTYEKILNITNYQGYAHEKAVFNMQILKLAVDHAHVT